MFFLPADTGFKKILIIKKELADAALFLLIFSVKWK
jgi:hypothetical protein